MHGKILKIFIHIAGFVCLIVFLSVRIVPETSMNLLLKEKVYEEYEDSTRYGELFYISMVTDFREELPVAIRKYRFSQHHPQLNDADIIVYGDSHFDHSRFISFPEMLSLATHSKVYYYRINQPFWGNALAYLETNGYETQQRKLFIYGSTERYIFERFYVPYQPQKVSSNLKPHQYVLNNLLFLPNTDLLYSTILKRSYLTHHLHAGLSTMRFRLFNYISEVTPVYHIDPENGSWLFIRESIDHFNRDFTDEEIITIANNIKHMAREMDERYNLDFLFFPIPERYSLYHTVTGMDYQYNNFITRLYEQLDQLGVPYVRLYEDYKNSDKVFFHRTDTHWNEKGMILGLEKTLDFIEHTHQEGVAHTMKEKHLLMKN
jgi:hypothetical protein